METGAARRWVRVVEEFEASGQGAREFAQHRGINPSTLKWWRSRLRRGHVVADSALEFVEVRVPAPVAVVRLRLDRVAASVDVSAGTDLRWLRMVVDALC